MFRGVLINAKAYAGSAHRRDRVRRFIAVGLVAVCVAGTSTRADAQDPSPAKTEYDQLLHEEQDRRDAQQAAAMKAFDLAVKVQDLDARIAVVQAELDAAEATLAAHEAEVVAADARVDEAKRIADREEKRLRDQSIAAYMGGGSSPVADLAVALTDPEAIDDIAKGRVYAAAVIDDRRQVVARFAQARADLDLELGKSDEARQAAQQAHDEVAAKRDDLQGQRDAQASAQAEAKQAADVSSWLATETEGRRREAETKFAAEVVTSDSIRDLLASKQKDQIPAPNTYGIFLNPIKNAPIVSPYGMRMHPILGYEKMHFGLDLDGNMGDPMRASEAGVVLIAGEQGGYGNTVVIDHGNQLATLYGHMSRLDVKPGDVVTRGQVVGLVGSTGQSTGPHCHWEVRVLGLPVDGHPYLNTTPET